MGIILGQKEYFKGIGQIKFEGAEYPEYVPIDDLMFPSCGEGEDASTKRKRTVVDALNKGTGSLSQECSKNGCRLETQSGRCVPDMMDVRELHFQTKLQDSLPTAEKMVIVCMIL